MQCVAKSLRKDGIYVLGLHLSPTKGEPLETESWSARRGHLSVLSRLWVIERNRRRRQEQVGMSFDVYTPTRQFRINDESSFRMYSAAQMAALLDEVDQFELLETYDFGYEIDEPIEIDESTEDVVYILRRR